MNEKTQSENRQTWYGIHGKFYIVLMTVPRKFPAVLIIKRKTYRILVVTFPNIGSIPFVNRLIDQPLSLVSLSKNVSAKQFT